MTTIVCPQCGNDASIQRVAALVAGNTAHGTLQGRTRSVALSADGDVGMGGSYTRLATNQQTDLARMLRLPPEPEEQRTSPYILPAVVLILAVISLGVTVENPPATFGWILTVALFVVSFILIARASGAKEAREPSRDPRWLSFKEKWGQLYYCHKHGIVFDPQTNRSCEPHEIESFVHSLIGDQTLNS